jgi:hypothetical protein
MLKRVFLTITIAILAVLAVASTRWSVTSRATNSVASIHGQVEAKIRPFTATVFATTFVPGNLIPADTEARIFAVRGDGSTAELFERSNVTGDGKVVYIKKILDVPGKEHVVVDPFSESVTTYPLLPQAVAGLAAKAIQTCGGTPDGEMLGYSLMRTDESHGQEETGPNLDEVQHHLWLASNLNCIPIRREDILFKDGKELQRTLSSFTHVAEGEPDPSLFEVPQNYVERPPSAVMAEASRRHPKAAALNCGTCSQASKDEVYIHAQKNHKQQ